METSHSRVIAVIGSAVTLVAASAILAAPASAAPPSVTITYTTPGLVSGNATTTGAQFEPFGPVPNAINVGGQLTAAVSVDYGASSPLRYRARWMSCPTRDADISACDLVQNNNAQNGTADGLSLTYTAGQATLGNYLRLWMSVFNSDGESVDAYGLGGTQPLVWPTLATGGRPTISGTPSEGENSAIDLKAWTLPAGTTFGSRTVQVWACPNASNGQNAGYAWNAQSDGCLDVSAGISSAFNTANATSVVFKVPAGVTGRYLVTTDQVLARFGSNTTGAQVRSAGTQVGSTPAPTPSPSPSASASPTPSPSVTAGPFRVAVKHKASVKRGAKLKVVVSTSSSSSIGEATVLLKKRPTAPAKALQTLKSVDVVGGTGQSVTKIRKTLAKGAYYLYVTYVDDITKRKVVVKSKVTLT